MAISNDFSPQLVANGLFVFVNAGDILLNGTVTNYSQVYVPLTPNASNYIYIDPISLLITVTTSGFIFSCYPIAIAQTGPESVIFLTDSRPNLIFTTGGSGGPVNFSSIIGNIAINQMASGSGANGSTFFRGDNSWAQVQFTNIPGVLTSTQIPNLSAGKITSGLLGLNVGGTGVDLSASGSSTAFLAQSGSQVISARSIAATDVPALDASKITTGQIATARGGTGVDLSATGGTTNILAQDASHVVSSRALVAADIPNLSAAKITSGQIGLAEGGTGVDLSASGAAHDFLAINASHVISAAQPAFSDISGTATSGQYVAMVGDSGSGGVQGAVPAPPSGSAAAGKFLKADGTFAVPVSSGLSLETDGTPNGSQTLLNLNAGANVTLTDNGSGQITLNSSSSGGSIALDTNNSANSSQSVLSLNNGTGIVTANPTAGNVTFTLQPAQAGTIGGTESLAAVTSKWIDSISTMGVPHASQPAFTDISGTASTGQIPNLAASKITSGTLALAQGGTNADLSAGGSTTAFLAQDASHVVSSRSIVATDVPVLDTSKITTGQLALARGGTGVDLSASGGTSNFLAIDGSHVISAVQPALSDIAGTGNLLPAVAGVPNIGSASLPFGSIYANQFIVPSGSAAILVGTEGTGAPTPQAGNDILYLGDSTSHSAQLSNNGGSFQSLGTWDTTTPTVHGVVIAGTFPAVHSTGTGTAGQVLTSNGSSSDSSFQSVFGLSNLLVSSTAPTIASGFGSGPSVVVSNGTAAFKINVGTGGAASSGVLTMPAANTGWNCFVAPAGAPQAAAVIYASPTSSTSVTLKNYTLTTGSSLAWTSGTVLQVSCFAY